MIVINTNAREVLRQVRSLAERGLDKAIADAMDTQNELTAGHIVAARMSGPRSPTVLGRVTGTAGRSVRRTKARIGRDTVTSSIGSNVHYVAVHEFGFSGTVAVKAHSRRVKSRDVRAGRKKVAEGVAMVRSFTRMADYPARHMIELGVKDKAREYGKGISNAIVKAWNGRA